MQLQHRPDVMIFENTEFVMAGLAERLTPASSTRTLEQVSADLCEVAYAPAVRAAIEDAAARAHQACLCRVRLSPASKATLARELAMAIAYRNPKRFRESRTWQRCHDTFAGGGGSIDPRFLPPECQAAWGACAGAGQMFGYCELERKLWFYRRPGMDKFLRRLARTTKQKGGSLQVMRPRPEELLALPIFSIKRSGALGGTNIASAIKVVKIHGVEENEAWGLLEVHALQYAS